MRRLLIVSPAFPPHPSPATHRARFLTRYAREFGWRVRVVAVDPRHYEEQLDHELARLLPDELEVVHVPAIDARWTRRLGFSDIALRAYLPLRAEVRRQCATDPPDLIFIPGGPFYTFRLGPDARERFGVPYVVDYTDPWVYPINAAGQSPLSKAYWSHRLATWLEPRVAYGAAHILAVSDSTHDGMRAAYPEIPAERFSAVPFGFEPHDFDVLRRHPRSNPFWTRGDGCVHVVYVGVMPPNGYETLRAIFAAVRMLRDEAPREFDRLRLHFLGTTYDPHATTGTVRPVAEAMGLGEIVQEHPRRIPYVDALNALTSANVLLGIGSTDHHYTASKIFPCIVAERPLVAVYHEASSVCQIVRETNAGALVTYGDVERAESRIPEIASALRRAARGESLTEHARTTVSMERYSARAMCAHVFGVFEGVLSERARMQTTREYVGAGEAVHV
jgi:glycosyltransferase involved in cell wall biosynthesis